MVPLPNLNNNQSAGSSTGAQNQGGGVVSGFGTFPQGGGSAWTQALPWLLAGLALVVVMLALRRS